MKGSGLGPGAAGRMVRTCRTAGEASLGCRVPPVLGHCQPLLP